MGAVIAAGAVQLSGSGQGALVIVAAASIAAAYAMFDASYLVFSVFLTSYIVVLLDLLGFAVLATAQARLVDTAIGAVLAMLAFLVWPTWEGLSAPAKFAGALERHRVYAFTLLRQLAHPREADAAWLRALQSAARGGRAATPRPRRSGCSASPGIHRRPVMSPALRPLHAQLREDPAGDPIMVGVTEELVDAAETIHAIVRGHIGSKPASSQPVP